MTTNINPATGIAYGYIAANALDDEVVNSLQMNGTDVNYDPAKIEERKRLANDPEVQREALEDLGEKLLEKTRPGEGVMAAYNEDDRYRLTLQYINDRWDGSKWEQEFNDNYQPDEPIHEGETDLPHGAGTVKWRTSWLGGALNVWIFESPFITLQARRASPCVPNAGILDKLDGDVTAYNVPDEWRRTPPGVVAIQLIGEKTPRYIKGTSDPWADLLFIIEHGFHVGPRDPALLGVIFSPKMRERVKEDAAYMVYDPSDDDDGFLLVGDDLAELLVETRKHIELRS